MLANADLHIHSPFSIATSRRMALPSLEEACRRKGIEVLGSGDALHPSWREGCRRYVEGGGELLLVPSAEVEDRDRVHHLVLLPDFQSCEYLTDLLASKSPGVKKAGRPRMELTGEEIAEAVHRCGGLIGPAHAFTPWTSLYSVHDTLAGCYGDERPDFLELGLSADTLYGARIAELRGIPFLTCSDAHSPGERSIGREWTSLELREFTVAGVLEAIRASRIAYNAGLFPELGKYNRTACARCHHQYALGEAIAADWRCPLDGGRVKKGVADRVQELSDPPGGSADARPPYRHAIPLRTLIAGILGSQHGAGVRAGREYARLVDVLGSEIRILFEHPIREIAALSPLAAEAVQALREGRIAIRPGGGGRYGTFHFQKSKGYCGNVQT